VLENGAEETSVLKSTEIDMGGTEASAATEPVEKDLNLTAADVATVQ